MKTILIALALSMALTGCLLDEELEDGYQFGDATKGVMRVADTLQDKIKVYCDEHENDVVRGLALELIHKKLGAVPEEGICELVD